MRAVPQTELVSLFYEGPNAALAAKIINGLADAYIDWGIETRTEYVGRTSSFINEQIDTFKQEIDEKEKELQAFGRDIDVVNLDPESNEIIERITQLNRSYTQAIADRVRDRGSLLRVDRGVGASQRRGHSHPPYRRRTPRTAVSGARLRGKTDGL